MQRPCPFCQNKYTDIYDEGGACCFCDYEGVVSIGRNGMFSNLEQYNKIYFASSHQERMDELHGRNNINRTNEIIVGTEEEIRKELSYQIIKICESLIKKEEVEKYLYFNETGFDFYFQDDSFKADYRLGTGSNEDKICLYYQGFVRVLTFEDLDELLYRLEEINNKIK